MNLHNTKQLKKIRAFTLIEMLIVLAIMGLITMMCMSLSGNMVKKVKNKTIKENIMTERQNHYSRNISTSTYSGSIYKNMIIKIRSDDNKIDFEYTGNEIFGSGSFHENFKISGIILNPDKEGGKTTINAELTYSPYKINCDISGDIENTIDKIAIITKVNNIQNYCFEVNKNNCRLIEVDCLKYSEHLDN